MSIILKAENISKQYRLGLVGTGTLSHDLNRAWHRIRGKEDPYLKIGAVNDRATKASQDYVWALKEIDFEVQQGEVLGIIGKNGAGKSTLLKILSRVTNPTTGVIKTKGRIASLLEVGTGFHPELTGKENIYLNGAILGMKRAEISEKLTEIIEFSGCEKYIDTPVKRYSSGMRVRLAFAVAAHLEPDILVVDEVLAVGDAEFQKKAIGKMQDISKGDGRTVLFVSHNMAAVQNLCTRCIVLKHGKISFEGKTDLAIDAYLDIRNASSQFNSENINDQKPTYIKDVYLTNAKSAKLKLLQSGDALKLNIAIFSEVDYENIHVELGIDSGRGERLAYLSNKLIDTIVSINKGDNLLQVSIDKLPFLPGDYQIALNLKDKNGSKLDALNDGFPLRVESGDFYNTGKLNVNSRGKYLLAHDIFKIR